MRMRLPSIGEIIRPPPEGEEEGYDDGEFGMDLDGGSCPLPRERPRSFSFKPSETPAERGTHSPRLISRDGSECLSRGTCARSRRTRTAG